MRPRRSPACWPLILALSSPAVAHETVVVCFNYGCSSQFEVRFDEADLKTVAAEFDAVTSPADELGAVSRAMGRLYTLAARQTPIGQDRGGNVFDGGVDGSMDCIDHSTNTTAFLGLVERRGWLKFHRRGAREVRGWFLTVHWTATIVEHDGAASYAVDTWFSDPGEDAFVQSLAKWRDGARPARQRVRSVGE